MSYPTQTIFVDVVSLMKLEVFMNGGKPVISLLTFFLEFAYTKIQIPEIASQENSPQSIEVLHSNRKF